MSTEPSVVTGTRGTAYNYEDFALTADTLTIDQYKVIPMFIDEADRYQQTYVNQMSIADFQGKKIVEKIESLALAQHSNWTDFGQGDLDNTSDDDTTAITVSAANVDDIIRAIKRKLYKNNGVDLAVERGIFIVWRPEDFELLEAFVQAWNKIIGLVKSLLINGESLRRKAMVTLSKQIHRIVQLQRLSVETPILGEAIVRTA